MDFLFKSLPGFAQLFERLGSDAGEHLPHLERQALINFFQGRPAAHHQVPDGDGQLAGHGASDQIDRAFAPEEFVAPLGQGMLGAQDGLCRLNEQATQVFAAMTGDAAAPLACAAVIEGWIEADIFDELFGAGKAMDARPRWRRGQTPPFPGRRRAARWKAVVGR